MAGRDSEECAAYDFTRKLTHTPHLITGADVEVLKKHYTPTQVLEILVTVAGYNSTNRWTDGLNIPAEANGTRFKREGITADFSTFQTPTSGHFAEQRTTVAPVKLPRLRWSRVRSLRQCGRRNAVARLPMSDQKAIGAIWSDGLRTNVGGTSCDISHSHEGACGRVAMVWKKATLGRKLKAEIAWVAARNDRLDALAIARDRLKRNGFTDDQVFALDGDRRNLPETEQAGLSPWSKL